MTNITNTFPYRGPGSKIHEQLRERQLWEKIRLRSLEDEGLRNLMDQVIMYYRLLENQDDNDAEAIK